jgi:site-specific DNA-methyltransferase (cytosine-N4-specific)
MESKWQGGAMVVKGDATELMLPDESVDLVVTSPPYFALRSYTDGGEHYDGQIGSEPTPQAFLEALWAVTAECRRVLKPSGSLWVNLGDKYAGTQPGAYRRDTQPFATQLGDRSHRLTAEQTKQAPDVDFGGIPAKSLMGLPWRYAIGCIDDLDLILRAEVVWSKPNGLPESVTDRVRRSHEQWFHFTKEPRYFAAVDEVREPSKPENVAYFSTQGQHNTADTMERQRTQPNNHNNSGRGIACNPLGKLPGSVWTIPSEPLRVPEHIGVDHFAAFPQEWPRRIILGWSPPDAVVLDPFGGTGTVAMVARALGRFGISHDLSSDYNRLARWRVWESRHECKTLERVWAMRNGAMVDGKPKIPAAVKREIRATADDMAVVQRRQSPRLWKDLFVSP